MTKFDYSDTDWAAIERLSKWYSGDIHDSLEQLGGWGYLDGISLKGALEPGKVVCGPAVTVQFEKSDRKWTAPGRLSQRDRQHADGRHPGCRRLLCARLVLR